MSLFNQRIDPFVRQMREAQVPEIVIADFSNYYRRLLNGETGLIPERVIRPVESLPDAESLPSALSAVGERHITQTAMGAAISVFYAAGAIRVPRIRFAPVKSTNDLLAIRSDRYILNDRYHVVPNPKQKFKHLKIDLDSGFYERIDDFESRFAYGPPSLINCRSLKVKGDFTFGSDIRLEGAVALLNRGSQPFGLKDRVRIKGEFRV